MPVKLEEMTVVRGWDVKPLDANSAFTTGHIAIISVLLAITYRYTPHVASFFWVIPAARRWGRPLGRLRHAADYLFA
jgi:hypothetical protein